MPDLVLRTKSGREVVYDIIVEHIPYDFSNWERTIREAIKDLVVSTGLAPDNPIKTPYAIVSHCVVVIAQTIEHAPTQIYTLDGEVLPNACNSDGFRPSAVIRFHLNYWWREQGGTAQQTRR